jgi:hypothetical protein
MIGGSQPAMTVYGVPAGGIRGDVPREFLGYMTPAEQGAQHQQNEGENVPPSDDSQPEDISTDELPARVTDDRTSEQSTVMPSNEGAAEDNDSSMYPDEAVRPSAEEIAATKATLSAAGMDASDLNHETDSPQPGSSLSSDDLKKVEEMKEDAEDELLSKMLSMTDPTNTGIITNIR